MSSNVCPTQDAPVDTAEDIAAMMAEAARVDALFQSGAISTMWLQGCAELPAVIEKRAEAARRAVQLVRVP